MASTTSTSSGATTARDGDNVKTDVRIGSTGEEDRDDGSKTKKAKHDFFGMFDDEILSLVVLFAAGDIKDLVNIQRSNKRCRDLLVKNSPLLIRIRDSICLIHGHRDVLKPQWELQNDGKIPVTLESLAFYQAAREQQIFDPQAFYQKGGKRVAVPQAALRVQALFGIMEKFPQAKASWESFFPWNEKEYKKNTYDDYGGIVGVVLNSLVYMDIIPDWSNLTAAALNEHININMYGGRRKYRENPIYNEYCGTVGANMHQMSPETLAFIWNRTPIHLKLLIVEDNTIAGRRRGRRS